MKTVKECMHYDYENEMGNVQKFLEEKEVEWSIAECYIVWEMFSDSVCAQFLGVSERWLELFWEWLNEDD